MLTTNLDNDDALSSDFAERLAAVASPHPRVAVYVPTGLIKEGSGLYVRRDPRNAFCSVLESWDAPVTCWAEYHNRLPSLMPVVEVPGGPGWLQVVHGDNVSNRVRGRLASPRPYQDRFPGMVDDVPEPTRRDLATDVLVRGPARQVRDGARSAARGLAIRVLGKDGFGQAKLAIRSRMRRG